MGVSPLIRSQGTSRYLDRLQLALTSRLGPFTGRIPYCGYQIMGIRPLNYRVLSVGNVGTSSGPGLVSRLSGRTGEFRWMGWAWLSEPQPNDGERSLPSPGNRLREAREQTEWAHW